MEAAEDKAIDHFTGICVGEIGRYFSDFFSVMINDAASVSL